MEEVYAALVLHKLGKPVDEIGVKKVLEAAGGSVDEAKVKTLIASLKGVDIDKELESATVMAAAPAGGGGAPAGEGKPEAEEKKEEAKPEEAAEGLSSLFG